jgi:hypothetical protein
MLVYGSKMSFYALFPLKLAKFTDKYSLHDKLRPEKTFQTSPRSSKLAQK